MNIYQQRTDHTCDPQHTTKKNPSESAINLWQQLIDENQTNTIQIQEN